MTNAATGKVYAFKFGPLGNEIDETTKGLYYIHENLFDSFTGVSDRMMSALEDHMHSYLLGNEYTSVILVSSVFTLTLICTILIFQFVRKTEMARIESLSLYSEVYLDDVE
jgi:hypothetical protein